MAYRNDDDRFRTRDPRDRQDSGRSVWNTFDGDDRPDRRSQRRDWHQFQDNDRDSEGRTYDQNYRFDDNWRVRGELNTRFGSRDTGEYYRASLQRDDRDQGYINWSEDERNRYSSNNASRGGIRGRERDDYGRMGSNFYSEDRLYYPPEGDDRRWGSQNMDDPAVRREYLQMRGADVDDRSWDRHNGDYDDVYGGFEGGRYAGRGNYGSGTNYGEGRFNPDSRESRRLENRFAQESRDQDRRRGESGRQDRDEQGRWNERRRNEGGRANRMPSGYSERRFRSEDDRGMYSDDPNAWSSFDRSIFRRDDDRYFGGGRNHTGDFGSRGETYDHQDNFGADRMYSRGTPGKTRGWHGGDNSLGITNMGG